MNAVAKTTVHEITPAADAPSDSLLAMIGRMAADPAVDIDKFERFVAMRDREVARQSELAFNQAMTAAQAEIGRIAADKTNPQTHSGYASYAALDRMVRPVYTGHGFALSFGTEQSADGVLPVVCNVSHAGGDSRIYRVPMPVDGKGAKGNDVMTKTHAVGSAMSYGQRYLLKLIFNIAIGVDQDDDDGNAASDSSAADWYAKIAAAQSKSDMKTIANEVRDAGLQGRTLRNVRAAWVERNNQVTA